MVPRNQKTCSSWVLNGRSGTTKGKERSSEERIPSSGATGSDTAGARVLINGSEADSDPNPTTSQGKLRAWLGDPRSDVWEKAQRLESSLQSSKSQPASACSTGRALPKLLLSGRPAAEGLMHSPLRLVNNSTRGFRQARLTAGLPEQPRLL